MKTHTPSPARNRFPTIAPLPGTGLPRTVLLCMLALICTVALTAAKPVPPVGREPTGSESWEDVGMLRGFEAPEHVWSAGSRGVQLKAAAGDAVVAPADGVVSFVGKVAGRPVVAIQLPSGWRTTVEPVDASVSKGDRVTAGERIGTVATGGPCDQRCVHWGLKTGSGANVLYKDPRTLLSEQPSVLWPDADTPPGSEP